MLLDSVIIHDIRSSHNVGAILRTCDGFGIKKVYIGGISPYPKVPQDTRLPHIIEKLTKDISKTSLGAEKHLDIVVYDNIENLLDNLIAQNIDVVALEQSPRSVDLHSFKTPRPISLLLGREVEGIDEHLLQKCSQIIEIPMRGHKESFNVSVACGIALYSLCT